MARPPALAALTYTTYGPVLESIGEIRRALDALAETVDEIEYAISHDRPRPEKLAAALLAFERIPELADAFERAVAPRQIETLQRRLARIRGVRADEFERSRLRSR